MVFRVIPGFSFRASGWHIEAPTLHRSFHHAFSPLVFTQQFITPVLPAEAGGNLGKRVRLTRKTR